MAIKLIDIDEAKRICATATPGPWFEESEELSYLETGFMVAAKATDDDSHFVILSLNTYKTIAGNFPIENGRFIAKSRELLPAAIKEIEHLRAENAKLKKEKS